MSFLIDMVHHNPGEPPFESEFTSPENLARLGYSGQVFKHVNCAVRFDTLGRNDFAEGTPSGQWMDALRSSIEREISAAKAENLKVYYHIDLFVLPRALVEDERSLLCNPEGKISLDRERTIEVHRALFFELFRDFPQIDGLIVRVGETYLFDTPFHCGNTAVPLHGNGIQPEWSQSQYIRLLKFLRDEICVRYNRTLIQRTWDIFGDRFHADPAFYLAVVDQIPEHEQLIFSIKHTALDFFRRVKVNPSLGLGKHSQVIEIQCQREYEGKGAFPNYIGHLLADGFPENRSSKSLASLLNLPTVRGVFTWSRGGGWYGPYLKNEFWCKLNVYIISAIALNPARSEAEAFNSFCRDIMGLDVVSSVHFRQSCILASQAILLGRYCEDYDEQWKEAVIPTELWMRDDRLGGMDQLRPVFEYLDKRGTTESAIEEKRQSAELWRQSLNEFDQINFENEELSGPIRTSFQYAIYLFEIIATGWELLSIDFAASIGKQIDRDRLIDLKVSYERTWRLYRDLRDSSPGCATLFNGEFWNWPGRPPLPGLDASVALAGRHIDGTLNELNLAVASPIEKSWFGTGVDGDL